MTAELCRHKHIKLITQEANLLLNRMKQQNEMQDVL